LETVVLETEYANFAKQFQVRRYQLENTWQEIAMAKLFLI